MRKVLAQGVDLDLAEAWELLKGDTLVLELRLAQTKGLLKRFGEQVELYRVNKESDLEIRDRCLELRPAPI